MSGESVSKQMLRIRIRMDPHQFGKPDPDPHQSKKQGPDPHQRQLLEAVGLKIDLQMAMDAHNGCVKGQNGACWRVCSHHFESERKKSDPDLDPHQSEKPDPEPDPHQV